MTALAHAKPSAIARKKAARLMAVQAIYQMSVNKKEAPLIISEYLFLRKKMEVEGEQLVEPEEDLFKALVLGVADRVEDLKGIVSAHRNAKEGHMIPDEPLLNAVLLCGVYELLAHQDLDPPLIITSYVEVAKAFFHGAEPSLVNGVLDGVRRTLRPN